MRWNKSGKSGGPESESSVRDGRSRQPEPQPEARSRFLCHPACPGLPWERRPSDARSEVGVEGPRGFVRNHAVSGNSDLTVLAAGWSSWGGHAFTRTALVVCFLLL